MTEVVTLHQVFLLKLKIFPLLMHAECRPYVGEFVADDPQRRLDLLKPKLPGGEIPRASLDML